MNPPTSLGVESPPQEFEARRQPHLAQGREPHLAHVMNRRAPRDVGSPGQDDPRRAAREPEGKQDRLEDQRRRAGCPHVEAILTGLDCPRRETHPLRAEGCSLHLRPADLRQRAHSREVLGLQAWVLPPGADRVDLDRHTADRRQGQRGAQHLSAPLSLCSVNLPHVRARVRLVWNSFSAQIRKEPR